jgi:glutamine amidotransferase
MCELFALCSDRPVNATFSLSVFGERGGHLGPHKDGWGIAFKEGRDFRLSKDAAPASDSACLRFIETHEFRSEIVLSHLRLATVPRITTYANTHPFARELFGACHVFAHNGDVPGVLADTRMAPAWNLPLGGTDSERAFCALMDRLRQALAPADVFDLPRKLPVIQAWADQLARHGTANFLLSDSEFVYAHRTNKLFYLDRQCPLPTETIGSPELQVALNQPPGQTQHASLVATEPLTPHEHWLPLPAGQVVVFQHGRRIL